jgi:hypothetical protein
MGDNKTMATNRAHIVFDTDVLKQVDKAAGGQRNRSRLVNDIVGAEMKRRRFEAVLEEVAGCIKDEDYPDLARLGTVEWCRRLRTGQSMDDPAPVATESEAHC